LAAVAVALVELRIVRGGNRVTRITTPDFKRADFDIFQDVFESIPWNMTLERRGVQKRRSIFQGSPSPSSKIVNLTDIGKKHHKGLRRPVWVNKLCLAKLRHKTEAYKKWNPGEDDQGGTQKHRLSMQE